MNYWGCLMWRRDQHGDGGGSDPVFKYWKVPNMEEEFTLFCFIGGSHQEQRAGAMGKHILIQPKEGLYNGSR